MATQKRKKAGIQGFEKTVRAERKKRICTKPGRAPWARDGKPACKELTELLPPRKKFLGALKSRTRATKGLRILGVELLRK